MKNISSTQEVAPSVAELQASYNRLYQEWLGQHRNVGEAKQMLDLLDVQSGLLLDVACGLGYLLDMGGAGQVQGRERLTTSGTEQWGASSLAR
jgi:hypothetical protein